MVYGGGGITPDIFVGEDTTAYTSYYKEASLSGLILQFCYDYTDDHRAELAANGDYVALEKYLKRQNIVEKFVSYADRQGLKRRNLLIQRSYRLLERALISRLIYNVLDEQAWIEFLNVDDPAIKETLKLFKEGNAFPTGEK